MKVDDWKSMATAPKTRMVILWGEVDCGDRTAAAGPVMAVWCSDESLFGEDGGWMVAFTDNCIASVESPKGWRELPAGPRE